MPELNVALAKAGRPDVMMLVGGVIPPARFQRADRSRRLGGPPGTVIADGAERLLEELNQKLGYAQRPLWNQGGCYEDLGAREAGG